MWRKLCETQDKEYEESLRLDEAKDKAIEDKLK